MAHSDEVCGHEKDGLTCDKPQHPFGHHMNRATGKVWAGVTMPEKRTKKGPRGQRVNDVVRAIEESGLGRRTGPPDADRTGRPGEAVERTWKAQQDAWLAQAKDALRLVCQTQETFTGEQVWALVDDIRERRAMVLVVRHGLKAGWMHEDHAIRVHGVWRTRDGAEFPLNKLVPVYRSDLFARIDPV